MNYILKCMLEMIRATRPNGSWSDMSSQEVLVGFLGYIVLFGMILGVIAIIKKYYK